MISSYTAEKLGFAIGRIVFEITSWTIKAWIFWEVYMRVTGEY